MSRARTLADLVASVRWTVDAEGQDDVPGRHTRDAIVRALNQALQELMELLLDAGGPVVVATVYPTLAAASQTVSLAAYSDALRIYNVLACRGTDGKYWPVRNGSWEELQQKRATDITGPPEVWTTVRTSGATGLTQSLAFYPLADASYSLIVEYAPRAGDLSADGDLVDGIAGYEDFIVYEAACRLAIRDANHDGRLALLMAERDRHAARIRRHRERGEVSAKVYDTRDGRYNVAMRRGGRYPWG